MTTTLIERRQAHIQVPVADTDTVDDLPRALRRSTTIHNPSPGFSRRHGHSKRLSLNFPILIPVAHDGLSTSTHSMSSSPSGASPFRKGTPISGYPIPSPDEIHESPDGPDFLTLVAGQERMVMELKEELHKAETELLGLKKQWATFEAKKKQAEIRNKSTRMGPVSPKSARLAEGEEDAERTKRREVREKKIKELAIKEAGLERSNSKGKGGRVLAGRHTRTLSLLQNNPALTSEPTQSPGRPMTKTKSVPSFTGQPDATASEQTDSPGTRQGRPSMSRQPTLQELIATSATGAAQLNFGKTYQDLAHASRKSLPPGTDVFVKQGKQVYDGLNQGFWNIVEDIRQATVGEEAINGPMPEQQQRQVNRKKTNKKLASQHKACDKHGKDSGKKGGHSDNHKGEKDNFWREFGVETPKGAKQAQTHAQRTASGERSASKEKEGSAVIKDHESKSSTDSKCPPSLLADLMDVHEDDEAWDNWPVESPVTRRQADREVNIRDPSDGGDSEEEEDDAEDDAEDETSDVTPAVVGGRQFASKKPQQRSVEAHWAELTT